MKSNPTGANVLPVIGWAPNRPACDLVVDPDVCGQGNRQDRDITEGSDNGQFAGERMKPWRKNREHNATQQCAHNHDRHIGIERLVGGLMEFNIGRFRETGHCAPKPDPVDHQSTGCQSSEEDDDQLLYLVHFLMPFISHGQLERRAISEAIFRRPMQQKGR